ncbi:hypothetical protein [Candidatus Xianfuyuplasma coldseepsis]|uniref:Uncharacterized protein n=1 Tax=Candidatus Xianfuyuplasma coldseepsis TaxID=2782163 RepID=A0A7L7KPG7_9MOLU|nr:hypothetical protein [Xianfuyuplasma coldseepsis]QMS84681.1 hypothetical protein G4Z02_02580 [Xianfuyuplasma coldseepsis]
MKQWILRGSFWLITTVSVILALDGYLIFLSLGLTPIILGVIHLFMPKDMLIERLRYMLAMLIITVVEVFTYFSYWGTLMTTSDANRLYLLPVFALIMMFVEIIITKFSKKEVPKRGLAVIHVFTVVIFTILGLSLIR